MHSILPILILIYICAAILLTLHAIGSLVLLIFYLRHRDTVPTADTPAPRFTPDDAPAVLMQLPIYNEKYVVARLLDSVAALDYPRNRLFVQLLDDSTDETVEVAAAHIARLREQGLQIAHVRRPNRTGYKAGALAYGLQIAAPEIAFAAVLDADFIPPTDFLSRMMAPMVADPKLGMVQARWGHLNTFDSALTMAQTMALDAHFVVEQVGRNRGGLLMNFNGTGGIWRIAAIHDAGGWHAGTLTEDLDLSYRAQLAGWHFLYMPELVVPGELPPDIASYKQQQARWAKGGTQCLRLLTPLLWRSSSISLRQKVMATLHLAQYIAHPLMMLLLLLTPVMILTGGLENILLRFLGLVGIVPPFIFIFSQRALYTNWKQRALSLPILLMLGIGMAWSNSRAVLSGLTKTQGEFKRTPKYADTSQRARAANTYALKLNADIKWELLIALYSFGGVALGLRMLPGYVPYLLLYALGFSYVGLLGLHDHLVMSRASAVARKPAAFTVAEAEAAPFEAPLEAPHPVPVTRVAVAPLPGQPPVSVPMAEAKPVSIRQPSVALEER